MVKCPEKIEATESLKGAMPIGYTTALQELPHLLNRVGLFDGPPKDLVDLVPDTEDSNAGKAEWTLEDDHVYWMNCYYTSTSVTLAKEIPKGLASCKHAYEKKTDQWTGLKCKKR